MIREIVMSNRERIIHALKQPDVEHRILCLVGISFVHNDNKYGYQLFIGDKEMVWVADEVVMTGI